MSGEPKAVLPEMTPWRLKELIERRVLDGRGVRLTPDTTAVVLRALRAYTQRERRFGR